MLLNKRYWSFKNESTQVERIEAEFKTNGLVISDTGKSSIIINKKGQRILYDELQNRFETCQKKYKLLAPIWNL